MNLDAAIISAARFRWNRQQGYVSGRYRPIGWDELAEDIRVAQVEEMRLVAADLLFDLEITDNRNDRRG